jgi:hypothetical protein
MAELYYLICSAPELDRRLTEDDILRAITVVWNRLFTLCDLHWLIKMSASILQSMMTNLFLDGKYSDLTISCQGVDFRLHRAIVCSQSQYFDAAVNGNFKVNE